LSNTAISLQDVTRVYQLGDNSVRALDGVSLDIEPGEFVTITGASGSGKSTLMHILGCLDKVTSGSYQLNGKDVSNLSREELANIRNKQIGFVFQGFNLLPRTTAAENVEVPLLYRAGYPAIGREEREWCTELARMVGLGDRLDHRPFQLSGGQQQRVSIARALVNDPQIILADEPTGNLDSATEEEIMDILHNLNGQGRTIIMVTHEPTVARQAKRQIMMKDGLIESETIQEPSFSKH
jgi:putative ABC transport system ATP-binding protein